MIDQSAHVGMTPMKWALRPLQRYADFNGRAPRAEYWWFAFGSFVASLPTGLLDRLFFGPLYGDFGPLSVVQVLLLVVPTVSVTVRRLHDIDRSGWWAILSLWNYLFVIQGSTKASMSTVFSQLPHGVAFALVLSFIAVVVILFVFTITRGTEGLNRYGPDPYGPNQLEEVFA